MMSCSWGRLAQRIGLACITLALAACASVPPNAGQDRRDPLESVNRQVFAFNDTVDRVAIRPVARAYVDYLPEGVRSCFSNAFSNLREPSNAVNNLLQGKAEAAVWSGVRLVLNSTFGIVGCFDVAGSSGIERYPEDFGQTLGVWGLKPGVYLVWPVFGPSSVRDTTGLGVETFLDPNFYLNEPVAAWGLAGARVINLRAELLPADKLLETALDPYLAVREAYFQRRRSLVYDGYAPLELDPDEAPDAPAVAPQAP
ncbi:MAG: VacJ family lipoprotein [Burkholderiaceae bacterium]